MIDTIKKLLKDKEQFEEKIKSINNAINALQNVCTHEDKEGNSLFKYVAEDSHYDYFECSFCGKGNKV